MMRALTRCMVAVAVLTCGLGYAQDLEWVNWAEENGGNGHDYAIVGTEAGWDEQAAIADSEGAWLADIADEAENDFVEALIRADDLADELSTKHYWFGLVQDPEGTEPGGGWGWSSGAPFSFVNWAPPAEPNTYGGAEDVGAMHALFGFWIDNSASSTMRAVLEREPTPPDDIPPALTLDTPEPDELAPPDGRTVSVAVTGSATDAETGVVQASLVVDDEYDLLDGDFDVTALLNADGNFATMLDLVATCNAGDADGRTYTITLHAVDGAENAATPVSQTVVVAPDTTAPTVALGAPDPATLEPPASRTMWVSVSVTGSAVDDGTSVARAWLVVDDEYDLLDGEFDVTALLDADGNFATTLDLVASCNAGDADGRTYMITLHAVDGAANAATPTSVTVLVPPQGGDISAPVVTLDPPSPDILWPPNRRMVEVIISGSVVDGVELDAAWLVVDDEYGRLDGSYDVLDLLHAKGRFEITIELQAYRKWRDRDGRLYTISLHATDVEGNKADPVSVAVICPRRHPDKTPPTLTLDSATPNVLWPPNGRRIRVKVAGSATDDWSGVRRVWLLIKDEYSWRVRRYNITRALDGDGNFEITVKLQASRRGRDHNGREYRLFLVGRDVAGNWGRSNTLVVRVPHNQ